jgi:general secretion pathway protein K
MTNKSFMTKRGIALITVLWISVLLSLIAASFTRTSRTEINLTRNLVENARAEALADAAVNRAVLGLFNRPTLGGFRVDGTIYRWRFGDADILFRIEDEGGKVDLNTASFDFLRKLLRALDVSPKTSRGIAASILDFRDFDNDPESGGAEDRDYRQANLLQGAKDAPFEMIEELQQVMGMTAPIYERLKPLITVYSGQNTPYPPVADPLLQELMKKDPALVDEDIEEDDDAEDFEDGETREDPNQSFVLTDEDPQPLNDEGTDARSPVGVFTIHAEARTDNGGAFARKAVVSVGSRRRRGTRVLAWTPDALMLFPAYDAAVAELEPGSRRD